ncbi:GMC oxidoreductase-domain-containing protein [Roridomyces roridus]|uniref:GMC oxidoreductase-domain-containing protein n=1 Tax=Roridomyces roridus TaxID=1738132 RepID=A0AAD7CIQ1_9AGAR|nr:GMC oxidoreductase-domain-containing protein [Roridomyces roridus]
MQPLETYDIIFAGGGATACVVAGRLAEADPTLKILIIEAGKHTKDDPIYVQPARFFANLASGGESCFYHIAKPSEALGNRPCIIPSGRGVGGGSVVNMLMYTRASPSDYDDWEALGNPGWSSTDLIPLSNKAETFEPHATNHGSSGPIKISGIAQTKIGSEFLAVAAARDKERGHTQDANDLLPTYVSSETGRRSDTAHHYIYNQSHNENLQVLAHCRVNRIIFEPVLRFLNDRAVGVEYHTAHDKSVEVYASKLVVVAAGTFGSPSILERSGIGSPDLLKALDIRQIVDLPAVGENYQDHNLLLVPYHTSEDEQTLDEIFHGSAEQIKPHADQWLRDGTGKMTSNGIEAGIKIRPNAQELQVLGPLFARRWQEFFVPKPDKPVMFIGTMAAYGGGNSAAVAGRKMFTVGYFTKYPASIGRTHIGSQDPYAPLDVEPGFLNRPEDWSREMARRMGCFRGEFVAEHPQFHAGSAAICGEAEGPVGIDAPDILGTCPMKPRAQGGVVDSKLNVYGVKNLKVADMSIAPTNVGSNTYNTALVVGEKAAVIIAEELGIKLAM